jgi:hypothetical protein
MKRLILIFAICLLAVSITSAQAEPDQFLAYGESRIGEFTNDDTTFTMAFDGAVGDVIYVTAALDQFVPVDFTLFSPSGGQLAQSNNTLIRNMELGADGLYTIEFVRPEWSEEEGEFTVHLGRYESESLNVEDDGWTLFYEGNLSDAGALQQFEVDFEEGELASMILYAANSLIVIQSSDGEFLLFEGGYDDPSMPLYRFPTTDTYTITIQTEEPSGTDFGFYLFKRDPIVVTVNDPIIGELDEGLPSVFTFESPAGKMWDINAALPQNGERFIALYDFDRGEYWEAQIEVDWGSGPDGQPRIRPFIPTEDGIYHIALWYDDWETEDAVYEYELIVSPSTLLSIPNDSPLTGDVSNETGAAQYAYRGNAGDMIRVTFSKLAEDGALSLSIYSDEDEVITFTGRNATHSTFEVELPLDGFYQFVISNVSYDEMSILEYEILVEPLSR